VETKEEVKEVAKEVKEFPAKKAPTKDHQMTLFVRNIGWNTN
jgi:hypothetical protein